METLKQRLVRSISPTLCELSPSGDNNISLTRFQGGILSLSPELDYIKRYKNKNIQDHGNRVDGCKQSGRKSFILTSSPWNKG